MIIDRIEKQIGQVLNTAKEWQNQAQTLKKQSQIITQQGEIKAREFLHQVFDSGLTLLGQSMLSGRKATESFVAETNRKVENLKNMNEDPEKLGDENSLKSVIAKKNMSASPTKEKQKSPKFKGIKNKKQRSHLNDTSRSH